MSDLDHLHYGEVLDLIIEQGNDYADVAKSDPGAFDSGAVKEATQADMDLFARG